ncbi:hypothetical protein FGADI_13522 [Fusarium gaditjirri]|uniref:Uncharacterized protein n=1 Tax=Fusarium gaditjirri TaxID=282569 RepID=A0A8H4SPK3_9HYPO|nr:hypothetical protein FGADI_13522 [Fusarium gaditjirri]
MEKLPGTPYISAQSRYCKPIGTSLQANSQHSKAIVDFALYFTASWKARQHIAPDAASEIHAEYQWRFERLSQVLPLRHQQNLKRTFEEAVGGVSEDDRQAIQIARIAGLFLQYGFTWEDGGREPVKEGTVSFMYLDVFCGTGRWTSMSRAT